MASDLVHVARVETRADICDGFGSGYFIVNDLLSCGFKIDKQLHDIFGDDGQIFEDGKQNIQNLIRGAGILNGCLLYTSPSPRDRTRSRMPSSA